jgi:O-antigen ligase
VNLFALLTTTALGLSLLIGASRFGWTDWALVNRFAGWFILLAYATSGALITSIGGMGALRSLAMSYAGATTGIVVIELTLLLINALGLNASSYVNLSELQGFAQNHNFLAFQLLMAAGVVLVLTSGAYKRVILGLLLTGLWFAGSRSGWISIACMLIAALYMRRLEILDLVVALISALAAACVIFFIPVVVAHLPSLSSAAAVSVRPQLIPTEASSAERFVTIIGGWKMFLEHPIFGAGLGAFRNLHILATSGIPLVIHSAPLWLLAELGLVGFLIFAIPGFYVWFSEWRLAARDPAAAIIALCFVGFAVMSGPADMVYQRTFWLIVGASLAVPQLTVDPREKHTVALHG